MTQRYDKRASTLALNDTLIPPGSTILIGLSGGPDSVYLLHALVQRREEKQLTLMAAHLNHEWRSDAADDAQFCEDLCITLGVPMINKRASELTFTPKKTGSREDHARQLRRHFFQNSVPQDGLIALAHHADDQLETFFIRLARGTSITGMAGMRPRDGHYIRPLLALTKQQILDALHVHAIAYRTDSTNSSDAFLRNRIRTTLIPALTLCDQRLPANILRAMESVRQADDILDTITRTHLQSITSQQGLDCRTLLTFDQYIQQRIILLWLCAAGVPFTPSNALLQEIIRFLANQQGGMHQIGQAWQIRKRSGRAQIIRLMQNQDVPQKIVLCSEHEQ